MGSADGTRNVCGVKLVRPQTGANLRWVSALVFFRRCRLIHADRSSVAHFVMGSADGTRNVCGVKLVRPQTGSNLRWVSAHKSSLYLYVEGIATDEFLSVEKQGGPSFWRVIH